MIYYKSQSLCFYFLMNTFLTFYCTICHSINDLLLGKKIED